MNKLFLFIPLLVALLVSCSPKVSEESKNIVGKWSLQSMEYQKTVYTIGSEEGFPGEFTWQFNEDGTYTASSSIGEIEKDNFDNSLPFRASGEYKGYYEVGVFLEVREEYRGVSLLDHLEINGSKMSFDYRPDDSEDNVKLTFTKI